MRTHNPTMEAHVLRIVSRGKTPAAGRLEHLPKLWLHAPVRFELACAAPEDTEAALDDTPTYSISIHSLDASRNPVDSPLVWYAEVDAEGNTDKSKGPHAVFELSAADIANVTEAGEYWLAFHAYSGGERIVRAAGYLTFTDDGFPTDPPTPTPPGTVYLTQAAGDARYVRDPGTVADNRLVRWDGVSGNQVQSSLVTVDDSGNVSTPGTLTVGSITATGGISASTLQVFGTTRQVDLFAENLTQDRTFEFPDTPSGVLAATANVNGAPDRLELYAKCDEVGGVTLGQAVYIYGANGGNKLIRKAIASGESTSTKTIGIVSQALGHNAFGYVVTEGPVAVSLAKGPAVEGDPVWLSPSTAGGVVFGLANKPSAPNHMVFMGYVTRITGANVTEIFVKVQNGFELEELHNVAISAPSTGHVLTWNGTLWVNAAPSGGGGGGGSVTITGNDGIGVAGSPGTSITLSLGNITPDALDVTGTTVLRGAVTMIHAGDLDIAISAANLAEGGSTVFWPSAGGNLAIVAGTDGAILASDITDGTTVGRNILKLTNPGAITFLRMNADNTVTALSDSGMRSALGLGNVATRNVGTSSGTAAAGDDSRFHTAVTLDSALSLVFTLTGQALGPSATLSADGLVFWDETAGQFDVITLPGTTTVFLRGDGTFAASGDVTGPASSTAFAVARFSGTGGKTLLNSSIVIDDETASTQQNVAIRNVDSAANSAFVLTPKGTGALIVGPKPDGMPTGGNARGANAVDMQTVRNAAGQVAGAPGSFIAGGGRNTTSGGAGQEYSFVGGGFQNTVSGYSAAVFGAGCTASGSRSFAAGQSSTASGIISTAFGASTASTTHSFSIGNASLANRLSSFAHSGGSFSTSGDAQRMSVPMRCQTTDATPLDLTINGSAAAADGVITSSNRLILLNNQTCMVEVQVVARSAAGADVAGFRRNAVISRNANAASTAITGLQTIGTDIKTAGATAWDVTLAAETTHGSLRVIATGAAATNINWFAEVRIVETIRT